MLRNNLGAILLGTSLAFVNGGCLINEAQREGFHKEEARVSYKVLAGSLDEVNDFYRLINILAVGLIDSATLNVRKSSVTNMCYVEPSRSFDLYRDVLNNFNQNGYHIYNAPESYPIIQIFKSIDFDDDSVLTQGEIRGRLMDLGREHCSNLADGGDFFSNI